MMNITPSGAVAAWCACLIMFSAADVKATLTPVDAWEIGDGKLTRDTETGLDWLNLTITNGLSINDILIGNYGNLLDHGFQWAMDDDVITLFEHGNAVLDTNDPIANTIGDSTLNYQPALNLVDLLGCTSAYYICVGGLQK